MIQRTPYTHKTFFLPLPKISIPVSIIVTILFAYILTRPVRALSRAFRRFSSGDLDMRLPVSSRSWIGLGGDDVRTLMLDFNHMAERVKELIEAQKLLVRDISHQLRSPLARLGLALELAREDSPEPLPSLDRAEQEMNRVNALIGEMLTLSLIESTRKLPEPQAFTMDDFFYDLVPDMNFEAQARNCKVICGPIKKDLKIKGQREMLRRAFENIIRNAIRYSPTGQEVTIEVDESVSSRTTAADDSGSLAVTIRDHGPGVPEVNLPHIFTAFYRVDMARQGTTGGFGVALAQSKTSKSALVLFAIWPRTLGTSPPPTGKSALMTGSSVVL